MADDKTNAAEYWKANVRLIFGCLAVWAFAVSYTHLTLPTIYSV